MTVVLPLIERSQKKMNHLKWFYFPGPLSFFHLSQFVSYFCSASFQPLFFPHVSFFFSWVTSDCAPTAPSPSNHCCFLSTHLPRFLSPFWRIVSTHERAQWSDQLAISSHKSIDLIPWRRDLHLPLHCSAPFPRGARGGLGRGEGSGALSMCLKLGCVCDRCKGIVRPKIHQFATQHFVNTGSGDVSKPVLLFWSFTEAKEFIHFQ